MSVEEIKIDPSIQEETPEVVDTAIEGENDEAVKEIINLPASGNFIEYNGKKMSATEFNKFHRERFGRASKIFRDKVLTKLRQR